MKQLSLILLLACSLSFSQDAKKRIFLTFDDGPINATTEILDVLKKHNVQATFFINGFHLFGEGDENEDNSLKSLQRLVKDGHIIGNHSYDHMLHNCTDGKRSGAKYCN